MVSSKTLLDLLRSQTVVDCDTCNVEGGLPPTLEHSITDYPFSAQEAGTIPRLYSQPGTGLNHSQRLTIAEENVQVIAYAELQEPRHKDLLARSIALSRTWLKEFREVTLEELAVEVAVCEQLASPEPCRH